MKVLFADDVKSVRLMVSDFLRQSGYDVIEASNGLEAWAELQKPDAPELILLDWIMPGMDGLEVVECVRAMDVRLAPYIILLTSKSGTSNIVAALAAGANDILTKSNDNEELLARLAVGRRMIELQRKLIAQADVLRETQNQLAHAQKLEAVGRLAAGMAHEINTPVQFVGDTVHFLRDVFTEQQTLIASYRRALATLGKESPHDRLIEAIREQEEQADLDYLEAEVPASFQRCLDGLLRISTIVSAMKNFAPVEGEHQDGPADINQALLSTLIVAEGELREVADVETELGELPPVMCRISDLNQVFLILIVNAAHAIRDVVGDSGKRGVVLVRTIHDRDAVLIEIEDTGCGIPLAVQSRVFDPFFTTKEVGRGSGQGLAIARSIIVNKHAGSLTFETLEGTGTTFTIRLPVAGRVEPRTMATHR